MKLIYLGCSFSWWPGKAETVAKLLDYQLINLAVPAGSNGLQLNKLQEYLLHNQIHPNDIFVWQLTYHRPHSRVKYHRLKEAKHIQEKEFAPKGHLHYVETGTNVFDQQQRVDLLMNSPMLVPAVQEFDFENELQQILCTMIMLKKIHPRLLVYLGSNQVFPVRHQTILFQHLFKHNIKYFERGYIEWVSEQGLPFDETMHPCPESGEQFATKIIYPMLQTL